MQTWHLRIGLVASASVAALVAYKLDELLSRLIEKPEWAQAAWRMDLVLLPLLTVVFSAVSMKCGAGLGVPSRIVSYLTAAVLIGVCASFFTLLAVGRVYVDLD